MAEKGHIKGKENTKVRTLSSFENSITFHDVFHHLRSTVGLKVFSKQSII